MTISAPICHLHQSFQPTTPFIISSAPPALIFVSLSNVRKVRSFMQWISQLDLPEPVRNQPSARKHMKHLSSDILSGMQLFLEAFTQMDLADDHLQAIFQGLAYRCANPRNLDHTFKVRPLMMMPDSSHKPYERALRDVCERTINIADQKTTCGHKVYPTMPALRALQAIVRSIETD